MYFNLHTHHQDTTGNGISIVSIDAGKYICCCGLDLRHTNYSLGIHPWNIKEDSLPASIDYVEKNAVFDCVKAIGECGLDKLCETPFELQEKAFISQILISEKLGKPLIIHCVKAFDELIALKKEMTTRQPWIIHGFRGKPSQAQQLLKHEFFLSFGQKFNEATLASMPLGRLFFETDVSEVPIESIYSKVASVLKITVEALSAQIERNVNAYFI